MSLDLNQIERDLSASGGVLGADKNSVQLRQERARVVEQMRSITETAERENRNLYREEREQYDRGETQFRRLTTEIDQREELERRNAAGGVAIDASGHSGFTPNVRSSRGGEVVRLSKNDSFEQYQRSRGMQSEGLSFDRLVRGMARGNWRGSDRERRAISGLTDAAGGVLLDDEVSAKIIDLSRAASVTMQAGAQTIPMDNSKLIVPRLLTDMKPEWLKQLAESQDAAPTFDALELEAKTVRVYAEISEELLEDADVAEGFISSIAAAAIAQEIDRVALAGSGADEEPLGLMSQEGVTIAPATGVAKWGDLVRSQAALRSRNFEPTAALLAPQSEADMSLAVASEGGQFIQPPASIESLPRVVSAAVPTGLGAGDDSALFAVGDWSKLIIGMRSQIRIQTTPLPKKYGVGLVVAARVDVGIERAGAFDLRLVELGD